MDLSFRGKKTLRWPHAEEITVTGSDGGNELREKIQPVDLTHSNISGDGKEITLYAMVGGEEH